MSSKANQSLNALSSIFGRPLSKTGDAEQYPAVSPDKIHYSLTEILDKTNFVSAPEHRQISFRELRKLSRDAGLGLKDAEIEAKAMIGLMLDLSDGRRVLVKDRFSLATEQPTRHK